MCGSTCMNAVWHRIVHQDLIVVACHRLGQIVVVVCYHILIAQ